MYANPDTPPSAASTPGALRTTGIRLGSIGLRCCSPLALNDAFARTFAAVPLVDLHREAVERPVDRVGEHERAGHERDAEHDRDRREHDPDLLGRDALDRDLPHALAAQLPHAIEHRVGGRVVELVDDRPVGEEHDPAGVGRGDRVVRHHHDRLAVLAARPWP